MATKIRMPNGVIAVEKVAKVLGLKHVRRITLDMPYDGVVFARVDMLLDDEQVDAVLGTIEDKATQ